MKQQNFFKKHLVTIIIISLIGSAIIIGINQNRHNKNTPPKPPHLIQKQNQLNLKQTSKLNVIQKKHPNRKLKPLFLV
ncbi:Hypothetical Protein yibP [Strawberry lethal yellows phytoplasma (CPA) str. NZSb11]|uniref:Uncharacterized protein n=1 Tax=Strawberry lethal yellows phytoplasma (CPA) str. NZSb11 TaxID=980422 RepID=R4RPZ6_PHYAS|nr:hypothetical protein [Candidatus Phytoplasma australiense]AGL90561.1 Hypothetical Protein yibP [Strawberry lethal yellows phytoplasma (CPA) str. NZSb11]